MDLYVYYRAPLAHAAQVQDCATTMQQSLATHWKISAALKRRPEEHEGCHTWMEVYLQVPAGFSAALDKAVADAGLLSLIRGERHVERFVDVAACA